MDLSLFGAALDTGNLGVSALGYATVYNIFVNQGSTDITVFDYSSGRSRKELQLGSLSCRIMRQGAKTSKRYYRRDNFQQARVLARLGCHFNPIVQQLKNSNAVLDISGGDSFTDLYGKWRFKSVIQPKLLTLQLKKPLLLLPQTYGPFQNTKYREIASAILRRARVAMARDKRSFEVMKDLLGADFDQEKHKCGVDVAFGLPAVEPTKLPEVLEGWGAVNSVFVGINVSGLIYNDPEGALYRYGFKADYNEAIKRLVKYFLSDTDCKIVLIPHVVVPEGKTESDIAACKSVMRGFSSLEKQRMVISPPYSNPCEAKWLISKMQWFCGTRMHSAIAALSSGIPTAAISYSSKTLGVFESCGQEEHVANPIVCGTEEVVDVLIKSYDNRKKATEVYTEKRPFILKALRDQFQFIISSISSEI